MTSQKDFKRLVRRRMEKTGESYTAARARLVKSTTTETPRAVASAPDYAALAGMSDAVVKAKTGCGWDMWVFVLDKAGAADWPHRDIAHHVATKYKTPDWWAQTVTVGYERIKGLRAKGQRRGGGFMASRSRTFPVSVSTLFRAVKDGRTRAKWCGKDSLVVTSATPSKYLRGKTPDGIPVSFGFLAKGAKSQLSVQLERLPSAEAATKAKATWGERLDALGVVLGS